MLARTSSETRDSELQRKRCILKMPGISSPFVRSTMNSQSQRGRGAAMDCHNRRAILILFLAGALAISVMAKPDPVAPADSASNDAAFAKQDWPMVGGYSGGSHYSALAQINTQNVKTLGAAWISQKFA